MDPQGIEIISFYLIYIGGILVAAFAWEVIRVALFGAMLFYVLRKIVKGYFHD